MTDMTINQMRQAAPHLPSGRPNLDAGTNPRFLHGFPDIMLAGLLFVACSIRGDVADTG